MYLCYLYFSFELRIPFYFFSLPDAAGTSKEPEAGTSQQSETRRLRADSGCDLIVPHMPNKKDLVENTNSDEDEPEKEVM